MRSASAAPIEMPMTVTGSDASSRRVPRLGECGGHVLADLRREPVEREVGRPADGEESAVGAHVGRDDELVGAGDRLHDGLEDAEGLPPVGAEPVEQDRRHASAPGR